MNRGTAGKYILWADDDVDDQNMLRELMPQVVPGMQLVIKDNGEDLLQFLNGLSDNEEMPALIILDLNMPTWDGIQTLSIIKQNNRYHHIPVVIFSTTANEIDRNRALSAGAVAFVSKPSRYSELQAIIGSFETYFNS